MNISNVLIKKCNVLVGFGILLLFFVVIRKLPFFVNGFGGIELVVVAKLVLIGIGCAFAFPRLHNDFILLFLAYIISVFGWFKFNSDGIKVVAEIIYLIFVCRWFSVHYELRPVKYFYVLLLSFLVVLSVANYSFAAANSGPGRYLLGGGTTSIRVYAFLFFLSSAICVIDKDKFFRILAFFGNSFLIYLILASANKISYIGLALVIPFLIYGFKVNSWYKYCAISILAALLFGVNSGYVDLIAKRFEEAGIPVLSYRNDLIPAVEVDPPKKLVQLVNDNLSNENPLKNNEQIDSNKNIVEPKGLIKQPIPSPLISINFDKSGRSEMFSESLRLIRENPIVGYNFEKTSSNLIFFDKSNGHPHNVFLELMLRFGIVVFTVVILLSTYYLWKRGVVIRFYLKPMYLASIAYFLIISLTGGDIVDNFYILLTPALLSLMGGIIKHE